MIQRAVTLVDKFKLRTIDYAEYDGIGKTAAFSQISEGDARSIVLIVLRHADRRLAVASDKRGAVDRHAVRRNAAASECAGRALSARFTLSGWEENIWATFEACPPSERVLSFSRDLAML